jgi:hypothetical protein
MVKFSVPGTQLSTTPLRHMGEWSIAPHESISRALFVSVVHMLLYRPSNPFTVYAQTYIYIYIKYTLCWRCICVYFINYKWLYISVPRGLSSGYKHLKRLKTYEAITGKSLTNRGISSVSYHFLGVCVCVRLCLLHTTNINQETALIWDLHKFVYSQMSSNVTNV